MGLSSAFALPFNPVTAVFTGLQEYGSPTVLVLVSKLCSLAILASLVLAGCSPVQLAATMATVNVLTAVAQWFGWRCYAHPRVRWTPFLMDPAMTRALLRSGGVLALWTLGGLLVSGLDVMIVGQFGFPITGCYSNGASATNFMLMCVNGLFAPLLTAVSAMQATGSPAAVGEVSSSGLPASSPLSCSAASPCRAQSLPIFARVVGGKTYAMHSVTLLRLPELGNWIGLLPYLTVAIATGRQHLATIAAVGEALVNVTVSLWLVRRTGASGVPLGRSLCGREHRIAPVN